MSFFPRFRIFVLLAFFIHVPFVSANIPDSVKYKKEWVYVYPYEKTVGTGWFYKANKNGWVYGDDEFAGSNLIIPMGNLPDGRYVQLIRVANKKRLNFRTGNRLRKVERKPMPYAAFYIKDGKLNGEAYFFDVFGNILETGVYKDNLKEGVWRYGENLEDYRTYHEGIPDGLSVSLNTTRRFGRMLHSTRHESVYAKGVLVHKFSEALFKDKVVHIVYKKADSLNDMLVYEKTIDGKLVEKGKITKSEYRTDTCYMYDPETGRLSAEILFPARYINLNTGYYRFWAGNLLFGDHSESELELVGFDEAYGVSLYNLYGYKPSGTYRSQLEIAAATQYYENGQKMISYSLDNGEVIMDTLFHKNGQPKYVVINDKVNKQFMARYFDESGHPYNEIVEPWYNRFTMNYKGHELLGNTRNGEKDTVFSYNYMAYIDTLRNASAEQVYTRIVYENNALKREVYIDTKTRQRHTFSNLNEGDKPFTYTQQITETFNEAYTEAEVNCTTVVGDRYKVITSYTLVYKRGPAFAKRPEIKNSTNSEYYDFEEPIIGVVGASKLLGVDSRNHDGYLLNDYNFFDSYLNVVNFQTTYLLDEKPFTGEFTLRILAEKSGIKIGKNKVEITLGDNNQFGDNAICTQDRFSLERYYNQLPVLPDLTAEIPSFYSYGRQYDTNDGLRANIKYGRRFEGSFKDGKLQGNWQIFGETKNKLIAQMTFSAGKATGECFFYNYQRERKGELMQHTLFENGQPRTVVFFNQYRDTLLRFNYTAASEPESVYFYSYYRVKKKDEKEFKSQLRFIKTGHFELGQLVRSTVTEFENGEQLPTQSFNCANDKLDGPVVLENHSGVIENGMFSGVQSLFGGPEKSILVHVSNNLVVKRQCVSDAGVVLWEVELDTANFAIKANLRSLFGYFPWTEKPYFINSWQDHVDARCDFRNWYENGVLHSEGVVIPLRDDRRAGNWKYYNPSGELISTVNYDVDTNRNVIRVDSISFKNYGKLIHYEKEKPTYEAAIISYISGYNCALDEDYQVWVLYIEKDILPDGTSVLRPTRYHTSYYDHGVKQSEGELVKGLPQGLWKFYDAEGGLSAIGVFEKGKRHGVWFSGDLTGLNFLGEFCLAPDPQGLNETLDQMKRDLSVVMTSYQHGFILKETTISGYSKQTLSTE